MKNSVVKAVDYVLFNLEDMEEQIQEYRQEVVYGKRGHDMSRVKVQGGGHSDTTASLAMRLTEDPARLLYTTQTVRRVLKMLGRDYEALWEFRYNDGNGDEEAQDLLFISRAQYFRRKSKLRRTVAEFLGLASMSEHE